MYHPPPPKQGPEILGMSNCLVVFTYEGKREESSVKVCTRWLCCFVPTPLLHPSPHYTPITFPFHIFYKVNDIAPVWNEEVTFEQVAFPPSSKVAITIVYRSGKKDEVLGVAAPGQNLWTTGTAVPQDRWLPIATKEGIYAGELNFHIHWTMTEVRYRKPFALLQKSVKKTQGLTAPLDVPLEKALNGMAAICGAFTAKLGGLSRTQKGLVAAVLAALLAVAGATVAVPALLFFPVTFVVLGGLLFSSLLFLPIFLVGGWLLMSTKPVQTKIVSPVVDRLLRVEKLKKLITLD